MMPSQEPVAAGRLRPDVGRSRRSADEGVWSRLLTAFRAGEQDRRASLSNAVAVAVAAAYAWVVRGAASRQPVLPAGELEWVRRLESSWRVIRKELDELRRRFDLPALIDVIPGERAVAGGDWRMLVLRYFGRTVPENCALCPCTAAIVEGVPGLVSASFSILQPGARIAAHRGIFAGTLRYHLGLVVPRRAGLCGIRIGGETFHWREGGSLLFDDTCRHEAWNHADEERIVLLLDVKRPLPRPLRWLNDAILFLMSRLAMPRLACFERMLPGPRRGAAGTVHDAGG